MYFFFLNDTHDSTHYCIVQCTFQVSGSTSSLLLRDHPVAPVWNSLAAIQDEKSVWLFLIVCYGYSTQVKGLQEGESREQVWELMLTLTCSVTSKISWIATIPACWLSCWSTMAIYNYVKVDMELEARPASEAASRMKEIGKSLLMVRISRDTSECDVGIHLRISAQLNW